MTDPIPIPHAPSASPPAPGRCPNCNGYYYHAIDNHRNAPSDNPSIGRYVFTCDECGFVSIQMVHGNDKVPGALRGMTGRRPLN